MSKGMSSSRLQRGQEAAKQLEKNSDPTTEDAEMVLGWDFAFTVQSLGDGACMYTGRLPQMKRNNGSPISTPALPDTAKRENACLVCL